MFWRGAALCIAAGLLVACASERTGFDYVAVMQRTGPPRPGQSRIVVLSEKASGYDAAACQLKIDDGPESLLKPGTYIYVDRPAGRHELLATQKLFPGDTRRDIATESGRTYFFAIKNSQRAKTVTGMAIVGGLAGALVASAATAGSDNPGPVDLDPLDESTARATLAQLQLAE
ncbi:DUF2846 domain-containing protein [Bradyrhizobium sp.]|uniref:DUF2846 domain-containing protein n=1 Tax=Bradyrhizobium sp. TaxID=376 RepID=UPI003C5BA984